MKMVSNSAVKSATRTHWLRLYTVRSTTNVESLEPKLILIPEPESLLSFLAENTSVSPSLTTRGGVSK